MKGTPIERRPSLVCRTPDGVRHLRLGELESNLSASQQFQFILAKCAQHVVILREPVTRHIVKELEERDGHGV